MPPPHTSLSKRHVNQVRRWTTVALAAAACCSLAPAQTTECASLSTILAPGNNDSSGTSISADGRFVAFSSVASDLVPGDVNGWVDVFVRDRQSGTTELVSVALDGTPGSGLFPAISGDGRFVAFASGANLVANDTNGFQDVFVRDRLTGTTELVSVSTSGAQGNLGTGYYQSISGDGRFVVFESQATNLVVGDTNGYDDIFVRDRLNGTTQRVSVSTSGAQGTEGVSSWHSISADGRFVAFDTESPNLAQGIYDGWNHVLVRDLQLGTTELVSMSSDNNAADYHCGASSISADGRFVAFLTASSILVPLDTNGMVDIFVRDRLLGRTERVSVATDGTQGNFGSRMPAISADGRFVTFESNASNLVPGDTNGVEDVFVHDRLSASTEIMSLATGGAQGNLDSGEPSISADGRIVAFESEASNLVPGDTNVSNDVFVRTRGSVAVPFCFGDGTGTACPCGIGAVGKGCPSSVNTGGGELIAGGTASIGSDTVLLRGRSMPNSSALYFQGMSRIAGGAGVVFGDGLRCIGGPIFRLGTQMNLFGASQYPAAGDPPVSVRGQVTMPGIRTYQVWYRNVAAFCTPATFNLTSAWELTWTL